jgi:hypothetical protein
MLQPLFNSKGRPIAYINDDKLFKYDGKFLGWLEDGEVWNGRYLGEIVGENRLLFQEAKDGTERPLLETPFSPGMPYPPWGVSSCALPEGFRDLKIEAAR